MKIKGKNLPCLHFFNKTVQIMSAKKKSKAAKKTIVKQKKVAAKKLSGKAVIQKKTPGKKKRLDKKNNLKKSKSKAKTVNAKKPAKTAKQKLKPIAKKQGKVTKKIKKEITPKKSLAKTILAKTSGKEKESGKEKKSKTARVEKKTHPNQKAIIVKKSESHGKITFKIGDYAVYPSHGVGKIIDIEKTSIVGQDFSCYLMYFEKEKLNIKIPINSAEKIGLRSLISKSQMDEVFSILRSGIKKLKGMWSRRAQEYETKINSGDIMLLAEVLRDLTRDIEDSERSYSERIIYETAIYRLASEYVVIYGVSLEEAKEKIITTARDKLTSEFKPAQKDEFDEFDPENGDDDEDDEEESGDEEDEEEDDFGDYDDENDDESPKKSKKKK